MDTQFIMSVASLAAGAFVMYKGLTGIFGEPDIHPPKSLPNAMWGDDHLSEHPENIMEDPEYRHIDEGVSHMRSGNALFEIEPETLHRTGHNHPKRPKHSKGLVY
jgi:hypothetical protein